MTLQATFKSVKFSSILFLGKYPNIYYPLLNSQAVLEHTSLLADKQNTADETTPIIQSRKPVKSDTELVIEGFPRSANTSAVLAFQLAQPHPIKVAYHHHVPAQIIKAVQLGIPTLVLIRNPVDAIASLQHQEILMHHWNLLVQKSLKFYIYFYESIIDLKHGYIVGEFRDITKSLNPTILKLNERFNTGFALISSSQQNETLEKYQNTPYKSSFSDSQSSKEKSLTEILSPSNKALMDRALAIYESMLFD